MLDSPPMDKTLSFAEELSAWLGARFAAAFPDCARNAESRLKLLHAEHNRWWTERLLSGWQPCEKPANPSERQSLKAAFCHWDMIPFAQLDASTQELDRVNIAAMSVCSFIQ